MLKKMFLILLLLFLIVGCSNTSTTAKNSSKSDTDINPITDNEKYLQNFNKMFAEHNIIIHKKYLDDFDKDNKNELLIFFDDLTEKKYANVIIISEDRFYYFQLHSENQLRFIQPINTELKSFKPFNRPEVRVLLHNIETNEKINYYIFLERKYIEKENSVFIHIGNESIYKEN